ncbi:MAG: transglycosylase family protein [Actinomycetota bacterium]|nr:transglycosylase family protein [Actinomycetota bacterium]
MSGGEGDGALDAEPTVERWRVVVVALATVAALPLFVLENPSSPGALTGTAGAAARPVLDASRVETIELVVATPNRASSTARLAPSVVELSSRAREWHLARSSREAQDRMAVVAHEHEAEALAAARMVAADEFAERAELDALLEAKQREAEREAERSRLRAEELRRREEAMTTPGPTTTIPWDTEPHPHGPSDIQWEALRFCEATGSYTAVNPTGKYRGAYQFSRQTWDWIAELHFEHLVGVDPAVAAPADQDRMAQALYDLRGRGQWPVCGRYLP